MCAFYISVKVNSCKKVTRKTWMDQSFERIGNSFFFWWASMKVKVGLCQILNSVFLRFDGNRPTFSNRIESKQETTTISFFRISRFGIFPPFSYKQRTVNRINKSVWLGRSLKAFIVQINKSSPWAERAINKFISPLCGGIFRYFNFFGKLLLSLRRRIISVCVSQHDDLWISMRVKIVLRRHQAEERGWETPE